MDLMVRFMGMPPIVKTANSKKEADSHSNRSSILAILASRTTQ